MISVPGDITILESVDSTNNYAMGMVRSGLAKHGDGFFAKAQLQGKGQRGKTWLTEPGANIIFSLVLQPLSLNTGQQFKLSACVALAVHDFFSRYAGEETKIKWPNDIYWRDRKAGGILIENLLSAEAPAVQTSPNAWKWAIAGMGININQTIFPEHLANPVSLKQITGRNWDAIEMTRQLKQVILARFENMDTGANWLHTYNACLYKRGEMVKFKKGSRVFEGLIQGVTGAGQLQVTTALDECFDFGEVEWVVG